MLFEETLTFLPSTEEGELKASAWGVTKTPPSGDGLLVEIDFHARRTLGEIIGTGGRQQPSRWTWVALQCPSPMMAPSKCLTMISGTGQLSFHLPQTCSWRAPGPDSGQVQPAGYQQTDRGQGQDPLRAQQRQLTAGSNASLLGAAGRTGGTNGETSLDSSGVLNAFLAGASPENGTYTIPFILHSDTIARLDVEVVIDYVLVKSALPSNLPEVTFPYSASTLPDSSGDMLTLRLPRHAIPVPGSATAQVRGEFQPTRVALGEMGQEPGPSRLSSRRSIPWPNRLKPLARSRSLGSICRWPALSWDWLTCMSASWRTPTASLQARRSPVLRCASGSRFRASRSGSSVTLPDPFRIEAGRRYWIVLQSLRGEVCWSAGAGTAGEAAAARHLRRRAILAGSDSARGAGTGDGPVPVAYTPRSIPRADPPRDRPGEAAVRRTLAEFDSLGRIEFSFDFAKQLADHLGKPDIASQAGTASSWSTAASTSHRWTMPQNGSLAPVRCRKAPSSKC